MKKLLFLSVAICTCICLTACSSENGNNVQDQNVNNNEIVDNKDIVEETSISTEDVEFVYDDEIVDFYDEYIVDDEIIPGAASKEMMKNVLLRALKKKEEKNKIHPEDLL